LFLFRCKIDRQSRILLTIIIHNRKSMCRCQAGCSGTHHGSYIHDGLAAERNRSS
jgi:hypothetical protein